MKTKELLKLIYETKGYHTGMIDAMVDFEGINLVLSKSELEKLASRLIEVEVDKRGGGMMHDRKLEDLVNHPSHYQGMKGLEVREVMENFVPKYYRYGGLVACDIKDAIKYILRAPDKNGLEDLKKAQRMIKYVIDNWEEK